MSFRGKIGNCSQTLRDEYQDFLNSTQQQKYHIVHVISVALSNLSFPLIISHNLLVVDTKYAELTIGRENSERENEFPWENRGL